MVTTLATIYLLRIQMRTMLMKSSPKLKLRLVSSQKEITMILNQPNQIRTICGQKIKKILNYLFSKKMLVCNWIQLVLQSKRWWTYFFLKNFLHYWSNNRIYAAQEIEKHNKEKWMNVFPLISVWKSYSFLLKLKILLFFPKYYCP